MTKLDRSLLFGGRSRVVVLAVAALSVSSVFSHARGQSITEFPLPSAGSSPRAIAAGADGALWFTEFSGNRIGRITTSGTVTEFALPSPESQPSAIAAGPDGNLWFTENPNRIGRMTTAGVTTEFTVPNASGLVDIAAGPDGNLWFTYQVPVSGVIAFGKIGRITPAGVMTEFDPLANSTLGEIAAGPDGALWFTLANGIGRIDTTGAVSGTTFGCNSNLFDITSGPDGNLWFTATDFTSETSTGIVGYVTPHSQGTSPNGPVGPFGPFVEFTIPTATVIPDFRAPVGSAPGGIVTGPDGNLWFTDRFSGKIGRATITGAITEFAPPTPSSVPSGITAGPDGSIWFTEASGNRIGRISNLSPSCTPSDKYLCLQNARFQVAADWTASDGTGGSGQAVATTPNSGYFWFFSPTEMEITVKAVNGCAVNNHAWIFGSGMTNVQVTLTVTDKKSGQVRTYTNPQDTAFQPIQDTSAFDCP